MKKEYNVIGYLCENCGCMEWGEEFSKTEYFEIDDRTLMPIKTDEDYGDDVLYFCDECREDNMFRYDFDDKKDMRKLLKMSNKERLKWAKKQRILQNLK